MDMVLGERVYNALRTCYLRAVFSFKQSIRMSVNCVKQGRVIL